MKCEDCINYDACKKREDEGGEIIADLGLPISEHETEDEGVELCCFAFKDKSKYIELPCKVGDIIDSIISHNSIVALYEEDKTNSHYSDMVWSGMAWEIPEKYKEYTFVRIVGVLVEDIAESDIIRVEIEEKQEDMEGV